jgi:hypothetical protein
MIYKIVKIKTYYLILIVILIVYCMETGARGGAVVEALRYKPEGHSLIYFFCYYYAGMQRKKQKISQKRQRRVQNHRKAKRKTQREAGQAYVSSTGKKVPAKTFTDSICGCSKKCNSSIST